jgi:hypothetical protein
VTAGTTLEVNLLGLLLFGRSHLRGLGGVLSESGTHGKSHGGHRQHPHCGFLHLLSPRKKQGAPTPSAMCVTLNLTRIVILDADQYFSA